MTTGWLLLLVVVVVSYQNINSQSTTNDEVCDGQQLGQLKHDVQTLISMVQQLQAAVKRIGKYLLK